MPDTPTPPDPRLEDESSDLYWTARSDARTLMEAEGIKSDSDRMKNARYMLEKEQAERDAALAELDSQG